MEVVTSSHTDMQGLGSLLPRTSLVAAACRLVRIDSMCLPLHKFPHSAKDTIKSAESRSACMKGSIQKAISMLRPRFPLVEPFVARAPDFLVLPPLPLRLQAIEPALVALLQRGIRQQLLRESALALLACQTTCAAGTQLDSNQYVP